MINFFKNKKKEKNKKMEEVIKRLDILFPRIPDENTSISILNLNSNCEFDGMDLEVFCVKKIDKHYFSSSSTIHIPLEKDLDDEILIEIVCREIKKLFFVIEENKAKFIEELEKKEEEKIELKNFYNMLYDKKEIKNK